jgi:hypothetical protein
VGARLRFDNSLGKRGGDFAKSAVPQALPIFVAMCARAFAVKSIFTLLRQYPDCRL